MIYSTHISTFLVPNLKVGTAAERLLSPHPLSPVSLRLSTHVLVFLLLLSGELGCRPPPWGHSWGLSPRQCEPIMGIWFQLLMIDSNWMMIDDDRVTILERYLSERLPGGGGLWHSGGGVLKVHFFTNSVVLRKNKKKKKKTTRQHGTYFV